MPSNKTIYKVKCDYINCKTSKIRSDKINNHYKHKHPHVKLSDIKFTKIAIKKDNNWVSLNKDIPFNITNGVETKLQKKSITSYFQKHKSFIEDSQIILSHTMPSSSDLLILNNELKSFTEDSQIILSHTMPSSSDLVILNDEHESFIEDSQIILSSHTMPSSSDLLILNNEHKSFTEDSQIILSHTMPSSSDLVILNDEHESFIEDSQIILSSHTMPSSSDLLILNNEHKSFTEDSQIILSSHTMPSSSDLLILNDEQTHKVIENSPIISFFHPIINPNASQNISNIKGPNIIQLYKKKEPNDPFHFIFFRMTNILINFIISIGPCQPCSNIFQYPVTHKRSMNISYYKKVNIDGSLKPRNWLSYSTTLDKVFCLYCLMFGGPKSNTFWTQLGVNNWKNFKRDLERHESSSIHKDCEYTNMTWLANKRIQDHFLSNRLDIIMENRNIVHNIIDAIIYLIKCNIAFWGTNSNEGNFMCLIKLMAKTVPTLRAYIDNNEKLRRKKSDKISRPYINLLSYGHVKKIIEVIKIKIIKCIIQKIKENCAYSIILDGTYDVSKKECIALLVRYIEDDPHPHPVERIIHVFTTSETTRENIKKHVFSKFKDLGLPLDYMVGQSMDGAGNMRGVYKGMQALILKEAPKAIYIWCHAHRLNLVVAHVCGCKIEMKKVMGILDELYNFMNGVRRQGVFVKYQMTKSKKSLKRIKNTTRNWSSSYKAVEIFLDVYEHIIASLNELKDSNDPSTSSIADGLLTRIKDEDFILSLFILKEILKCTHEACIEMQAVGNDLAMVTKLIQHTKNKLQRLRANGDNIFLKLHSLSNSYLKKNNVTTELHNIKSIFKFDQTAFNNYVKQKKNKYKREIFFPVLDTIINDLNERFNYDCLNFLSQISLFTPAGIIANDRIEGWQISQICHTYQLNAQDIAREYNDFRSLYLDSQAIIYCKDLLKIKKNDGLYIDESIVNDETEEDINNDNIINTKKWIKYSFILPYRLLNKLNSYSNLYLLYKYLLTLPTTSCSAERVMSKVKINKTRMRNKISDPFLENLLLISSEIDVFERFKIDDIITRFASTSKRLTKLLIK
ncbi:zinc finger MYM-type protein 1-like [Gordionus sp. m RMFG-2023]|uniref:zinc finger MYM-type protein 1-like n=1 Tax=Gordionus sp. m RMFG-2023 TaxID=3053472 RepID=UPI0031FC0DA4